MTYHHPFTAALIPGKNTAPIDAWFKRADEARAAGAEVLAFTETVLDSTSNSLRAYAEEVGWSGFSDRRKGPANITTLWAPRFTLASEPYVTQLHAVTIRTRTGVKRPPTFGVTTPLLDQASGQVLLAQAGHLELENTPRRRLAKAASWETLKEESWDEGRLRHPDAAELLLADFNAREVLPAVRDAFTALFPNLTAAWGYNRPRLGGGVVDWQAASSAHLELVSSRVLLRRKGDLLDHPTDLATWGWRNPEETQLDLALVESLEALIREGGFRRRDVLAAATVMWPRAARLARRGVS